MKLFIVALSLLASTLAFSGEIILSNRPVFIGSHFDGGEFVANEDLGRAWVELTFSNNDSDLSSEVIRILVKGMSFDKTTNEIIIEDETGRTVCAVLKKGFLGVRRMRETRNCAFKKEFYTATWDDGFELRSRERQTIKLVF